VGGYQEEYPRTRTRQRQRPAALIAGICVLAAAGIIAAVILTGSPGAGSANGPATGPSGRTTPAGTGPASQGTAGPPSYRIVRTLSPGIAGVSVKSVALSPDATLIAAGESNGRTYLWNVATRRPHGAALRARGANQILAVAFSPDGATLATGGRNGTTYLWNVATGQLTATLPDPGPRGEVNAVAFSPRGTRLAVGSANGHTYLWNVAAGRPGRHPAAVLTEPSHEGIWSAVFSSRGTLATGDYGGSIYLWDIASGTPGGGLLIMPGSGYHPVTALAFSSDGRLLAAGDRDGAWSLWNVAAQSGGKPISAISVPVWSLAFTRTGRLAMGDGNGVTYLWQLDSASQTATLTGSLLDPATGSAGVGSVAVSADGTWLVTGDSSGITYLWRAG